MRSISTFFILLTLTTTLVITTTAIEDRIYSIYHNLGNGFKARASKIHVGIENAIITTNIVPTTTATTCNNEQQECQGEMLLFRNLLEDNKMYQLKVIDEETNKEVIMSVPSCSVLRSNFREEVTLHLNPTADLISISYKPLISPLAAKLCDPQKITTQDQQPQLNFTTTVSLDSFTPSMTVPLVLPPYRPPADIKFFSSYRTRLSQQQQQVGSDGKPIPGTAPDGQNQSFLRKYWYIILPVMIMSLTGGGAQEEEGAAGAAAAGATAVASTQASAGAKPRRGKRS